MIRWVAFWLAVINLPALTIFGLGIYALWNNRDRIRTRKSNWCKIEAYV